MIKITLFDGKPIEMKSKSKSKLPVVISASRMTDMPKFYTKELINEVKSRIQKGVDIHTLVLWTKHPDSLLENQLYSFLENIKQRGIQLYLQCTITGLGQKIIGKCKNGDDLILEPNVPTMDESIEKLDSVISLLEKPSRIRLRIDPIVRVKDYYNNQFSSLRYLPIIVQKASSIGIKTFSFSFLESGVHNKVDRRFKTLGVEIIPPNKKERENTIRWLKKFESQYDVNINACCVPEFEETKCINGLLLKELHDEKRETFLSEPRKRDMCGCTKSIDIGGWPPKKCFTGCQYCYANSSY